MENILIAIVLCFNIFIPGKCQINKIIQPHTVINANGIITYKCEFNWKVNCIWKHNGSTISIHSYKFRYVTGNGKNIKDCSISTSESEIPSKFLNLQCIEIPILFKNITGVNARE
ncbi:hypothetical protein CHUAL_010518 [Chamberlinius hualienensis]